MGAYLTPGGTPTGFICRRLFIPAGIDWLAIVNGALSELTKAYNFELFGAVTPEEAAEIFLTMYERYIMEASCMIGSIIAYPNTSVPSGLLVCDGSTHDRVDYPDLYAVLHADYRIDADTFFVPNLRDRFVVGAGNDYALGDTGGESAHTLTEAEMPAHVHSYNPPSFNLDLEDVGGPDVAAGLAPPSTTGSTGGGQAHENRPPYYALVWAIVAR